jgi:hypothetical protein
MSRRRSVAACTVLALALLLAPAAPVHAQTPPPTPGPTNPNPTQPPGVSEKTMVVNPTLEECRRGWVTGSQWTKEQFDKFCADMTQSK